jgi:hypothetical protein
VWHRLINRPVTLSVGLDYHGGQRGVAALVRRIAAAVNVAPRDAWIGLVDGQVQRRHARNGRALEVHRASAALSAAVRGTATAVTLPMKPLAPRVSDSGPSKTIAVDVGRNRLTLYDGLKVEMTYPVATAKPGFYTPRGAWRVLYKLVNPTWVNPAPHGWGAGKPAVIPPGPVTRWEPGPWPWTPPASSSTGRR